MSRRFGFSHTCQPFTVVTSQPPTAQNNCLPQRSSFTSSKSSTNTIPNKLINVAIQILKHKPYFRPIDHHLPKLRRNKRHLLLIIQNKSAQSRMNLQIGYRIELQLRQPSTNSVGGIEDLHKKNLVLWIDGREVTRKRAVCEVAVEFFFTPVDFGPEAVA